MNKLTSEWVYNACQTLYFDNSAEFYDVDMFIGDIENAISDACDKDFVTDSEKLETDADTYNEVLSGLMGWLRSADGVDNWNDEAACIMFIELEKWAYNKFRSEED